MASEKFFLSTEGNTLKIEMALTEKNLELLRMIIVKLEAPADLDEQLIPQKTLNGISKSVAVEADKVLKKAEKRLDVIREEEKDFTCSECGYEAKTLTGLHIHEGKEHKQKKGKDWES